MLRFAVKRSPTRVWARAPLLRSYSTTEDESRRQNVQLQEHSEPNSCYPLMSDITPIPPIRIKEFRDLFSTSAAFDSNQFLLQGRILSIRKSGKSLIFMDIIQDNNSLQIMINAKKIGQQPSLFKSHHSNIRKGDLISILGTPCKTNSGELTLNASTPINLVSPRLRSLPNTPLNELRKSSDKVLQYLLYPSLRLPILIKSSVISTIRNYLISKNFIEVQTPILANLNTSGANAKPFETKTNSINLPLSLRVAPELWLKRLIISGFDKVFEIGQSFRNEGIDKTHNVEFITCEFYSSWIEMIELMEISEEMLQIIFNDILKKFENLKINDDNNEYNLKGLKKFINNIPIDNENGRWIFQKLEFIPEIEKSTGLQFPISITSESLILYHQQLQLNLPIIKSVPKLLDNLSKIYLEPKCKSIPTFIYNHPSMASPLSKSCKISYDDSRIYDISKRFELFINSREYINAYEEENNPFQQNLKFKYQLKQRENFNDDEMLIPDSNYLKAMELGMPPTGGFGLGIDRLCMLIMDCIKNPSSSIDKVENEVEDEKNKDETRIEEVLSFGNLKDVVNQ